MRIRFAGSGIGDCKLKKKAGKEFRRRTAVLVDERVVIDPTEDVFDFAAESGLSDLFFGTLSAVLTYAGADDYPIETIERFSKRRAFPVLAGNGATGITRNIKNAEPKRFLPYEETELTGVKIIPIPANEPSREFGESKYNLIVKTDKTVYIRLHGGFPNMREWRILERERPSCFIFGAPLGDAPISGYSITKGSLEGITLFERMLENSGISDEKTRYVIAALPTDKTRSIHEELVSLFSDTKTSVAYDGYFLNV